MSPETTPDETVATTSATSAAADPDFVVVEDGRRIYYPCSGDGSTDVVLVAGLGNSSFVWSDVQTALAKDDSVRVCLFERAGLGPSDLPERQVDATDAVADLLDVMEITDLSEHVVIVGASYGGLVAQLFARSHPERVAGVVLVDATHPDLDERIESILPPQMAAERRSELGSGPELVSFDGLLASDAAVSAAPPFPPVPLIVLRHGLPFESTHADYPTEAVEALWTELQDDLAAASPCSAERVAETSGHRIHQDQPEFTATAILDVVAAVENGSCPT